MAKKVNIARRSFPPAVFQRAPATTTAIVPVSRPAGSNRRFAALKAKMADRLAGMRKRAAAHAAEKKDQLMTAGGGVALGLGRRFLPDLMAKADLFGVVPAELTLGVAGYIAGHFVNNEYLDALTTAALTVGGYKVAAGEGVSGTDEGGL